jgi:hypothetical protein
MKRFCIRIPVGDGWFFEDFLSDCNRVVEIGGKGGRRVQWARKALSVFGLSRGLVPKVAGGACPCGAWAAALRGEIHPAGAAP